MGIIEKLREQKYKIQSEYVISLGRKVHNLVYFCYIKIVLLILKKD